MFNIKNAVCMVRYKPIGAIKDIGNGIMTMVSGKGFSTTSDAGFMTSGAIFCNDSLPDGPGWHRYCTDNLKTTGLIMKNNTAIWIIAFIFLITAGCEKIEVGEPFTCATGKTYHVEDGLSFSIDSINDSRCPIGVLCIWTGDVSLYFSIRQNTHTTDTLISMLTRNPFTVGNYTWRIIEVNPYPEAGREIDPADYRVKMVIFHN